MAVVCARCAGLDGHQNTVVAGVLVRPGRDPLRAVRTFGPTTPEVLALQTWLPEHHVTPVAMESTESSGKPLFTPLESRFTTWLVNPAPIQAVPGRQTDGQDAEGIADLWPQGLLRPCFMPDRAQRELRARTRCRKSLIEERAREHNRVQKVLEGAHITLRAVLSDGRGASGTRILAALADESRTRRRGRMSACTRRRRSSGRPLRGGWRRTRAVSGNTRCSIWTPWTPCCRRWMRRGRLGGPL